jgi:hypothetical protein
MPAFACSIAWTLALGVYFVRSAGNDLRAASFAETLVRAEPFRNSHIILKVSQEGATE